VERLVAALAAVVFGAAACELAIALGWIEPGRVSDVAGGVAALAMFAGGVTIAVSELRGRVLNGTVVALLPLAAVAHVVALFYSYDTYFLPHHRRFSDGGNFAGTAIVIYACIVLAVAAVSVARPRVGVPLVALTMLFSVFFAALEADGH
jgi:hypothetical protein